MDEHFEEVDSSDNVDLFERVVELVVEVECDDGDSERRRFPEEYAECVEVLFIGNLLEFMCAKVVDFRLEH